MLALSKMLLATALAVAIFLLSGCSQSFTSSSVLTTVNASEPSATEPVTAKTAYVAMYRSAYKWAPDVVLLRLNPSDKSGFTSEAGKSGLWEAMFASASKHEYRTFTYAVAAHSPDIYKGVTVGNGAPWSGPTRDVMPIPAADFTVDSDAAYTAAATDAAAWLKKNTDKKVTTFQLGNGYSFPSPVWYVVWGDKKSGGYAVFVNATTGKVMKK
jgi:hypothetical protein